MLFTLHVLLCILFRRSFKVHIGVPVHVVKVCRWSRGMSPFSTFARVGSEWSTSRIRSTQMQKFIHMTRHYFSESTHGFA